MKKTFKTVLGVICLVVIAGQRSGFCDQNDNTLAFSNSPPDLEKALNKFNNWRANHTNSIYRFNMNVDGADITITSYFLGDEFKVLTQAPSSHNDSYIEFLSTNGDVLDYFPSTKVTVKDPNLLNAYILRELTFSQKWTAAKVDAFGGKLEYRREDNRDCLVISIPADPFPKTKSDGPVQYSMAQEMQMDEDGKVVRQILTFNGTPSVSQSFDIEYITFDPEKVKAAFESIVVKPIVDQDITLEDAVSKEDAKNASSMPPPGRKVLIGVLLLLALIPIGFISVIFLKKR